MGFGMSRSAIAFAAGLMLGAINDAHALGGFSSDAFVKKIETMLGLQAGATKVVPQLGLTLQYLGTRSLPGQVYAVYVKKLSGE